MLDHWKLDVQGMSHLLSKHMLLNLDDIDNGLTNIQVKLAVLDISPLKVVGEPLEQQMEFPGRLRRQIQIVVDPVR